MGPYENGLLTAPTKCVIVLLLEWYIDIVVAIYVHEWCYGMTHVRVSANVKGVSVSWLCVRAWCQLMCALTGSCCFFCNFGTSDPLSN